MVTRSDSGFLWARISSVVLGLYALVGGVTSFIGWPADLPRLTDWVGDGISIQPNATLASSFAGAALVSLGFGLPRAARVCGVLVMALGGSALFEQLSGIDLGIDSLLMFDRQWGRVGVLFPGRMGPPGATSWTIIGLAIAIASSSRPIGSRLKGIVPFLAWLTMGIASLSLIGYFYGADRLYTIPTATVIALQTSTFILATSLGLMFAVPEHGPTYLLTDSGPAGVLVRRILPAVIVVPVVLGFFRLRGEQAGFYDLAFGTAVRTLAEIVLLLGLLSWTAGAIARQTRRRTDAEEQLRDSRHQLQIDLADSQLLQRVSAEIIREGDEQSLYDTIIDTSLVIMQSRCASMQTFDSERRQLQLLSVRGFDEEATQLWKWVGVESGGICGRALQTGQRVMVADVLTCDFLAGSDDLAVFRRLGIRAVQSSPLVSRTGELMGMISTHWNRPHQPSERELRLLDVVARQAADLIERRRSADALRHADRRKDEFLVTLAHELRNPLAPIRSVVDLMKQAPVAHGTDLSWARAVLDRQTGLMSRLLDDLLDVGRIARDKLELRTRRVDLGAVIKDAVEMNRPLVDEFGHDLTVVVPHEPMYMNADAARLSQVFGNLLNNASRYTPSGGQISLTAEHHQNEAVVRVRDNGIGIPSDRLLNIFDMFSQVDRSLERAQRGLGIGLHLVKRLVEMHNGTVTANSDGLGKGSELLVRLPLAMEDAITETPSSLPVPDTTPALARRILVVDDNIDGAESLGMLLQACGHETHVVHDGLAALEAAERLRPDVILLDIGLPKVNGFEACRRIRERPWGKDMVLIALTGWGHEIDRRRSQESGFDHHIVKPVEHAALVKLLVPGQSPDSA
jgi:signal transduction histidine kinase/CheY-like chemotaxis protein